jgi:LysW-gamma-L-lysine carboxypeptidase
MPLSMDSLALLEGLLAHYSPTGEEAGAAAYLVEQMQAAGFRAEIDPAGNAVGQLGDGPREILLLGHIDTVPGFIPVHYEDDRFYGRGAVDAKGPLACFAAAVASVGARPGWRFIVVGAAAEEGDSHGAKYLCANHRPPEMVVIGEPSGWDHVTLGYKGSLWLDYRVSRPLAHTAARVPSAGECAVGFWNALSAAAQDYNAGHERVFEQLSPSLREMNSVQDGFTQTASLRINLRIPPALDEAEIRSLLNALSDSGELRWEEFTPAYRAEKNTALVRALLAGIRRAGGQPGFTLKSGTSDMNLAGPAWSCPILAYGPGDSSLDHTPEERILIGDYLKGIQALSAALEILTREGN